MTVRRLVAIAVLFPVLLTGCGADGEPATETSPGEQRYPGVVEVTVEETGTDTYTFHVTISSPYDTPDRYADGWRIMDSDGTVYGEHTLMHDHANEQPFTRTQSNVEIPAEVTEVTVEGRDIDNGYGGDTVTVELP